MKEVEKMYVEIEGVRMEDIVEYKYVIVGFDPTRKEFITIYSNNQLDSDMRDKLEDLGIVRYQYWPFSKGASRGKIKKWKMEVMEDYGGVDIYSDMNTREPIERVLKVIGEKRENSGTESIESSKTDAYNYGNAIARNCGVFSTKRDRDMAAMYFGQVRASQGGSSLGTDEDFRQGFFDGSKINEDYGYFTEYTGHLMVLLDSIDKIVDDALRFVSNNKIIDKQEYCEYILNKIKSINPKTKEERTKDCIRGLFQENLVSETEYRDLLQKELNKFKLKK